MELTDQKNFHLIPHQTHFSDVQEFFIPTMPNSVNEIKDWIKNWAEEAKKSEVAADPMKIWGKVSVCFFYVI